MLSANYVDYEVTQTLGLIAMAITNNDKYQTDLLIRAAHLRLEVARDNFKKQMKGV